MRKMMQFATKNTHFKDGEGGPSEKLICCTVEKVFW